ncbi:PAS/PAC sensor hybrid histidine kinase [Magnetococcus marinus MC-1]|uniref:histidine kinase n=1 Tax=Magnetococcus marinus (strain ATCC BAA-1437 / JCM 17883 / MC-1) TaxID=156889 RepID=A0LCR8_MAGMM|nr:response regulator [Magnetococcus marinus]ABK45761.1 PAS/PAC sensor hybrid histidine kinase [Magnetococcus marinus MC-1]
MVDSNDKLVNILLVEDSKSFAALLQGQIQKRLGFRVVWADSLAQTRQHLEQAKHPFLLAILDLHLPDGPHGEVVDLVLQHNLPAIVLTGDKQVEMRTQLFKKGVLDYFVKDNRSVIDAVIHSVLRVARNRHLTMMVVDDSRSARAVLGQFLQRYGFQVRLAQDGAEAWALLQETPVDLVVTDYEMPNLNGVALTAKLRSRYSRDEMGIMGLSSAGQSELAVDFIKAGANDYINKPYEPEELISRVYQMAESVERYGELNQMVARHKAVLDNAQDAIITTDQQGDVLSYNPAAERLFGYPRQNVMGVSLTERLIPESLQNKQAPSLTNAMHGALEMVPNKGRLEAIGKRIDGELIDLQVALSAMPQQGGELHYTAFIQDITDKKQLLKSLEETLSAAESASKAKSAFIANMSHEIRTPMNAVLGFTDLALRGDLSPKVRDYLEKTKNASHSLMGIINDILDFSKMDVGRLELDPVKFDLHFLLERLADLFSKQAADHAVDLVFLAPLNFNQVLYGDAMRLEQIFINLIRNAVKFTKNGFITVRAQPELLEGHRVRLTCSVSDSGIGIDPEQLPHLFAPFVQADSSTTRRFGGTGLGLSIVKRLVSLMDGSVWAESEPGKGSQFHFEILVDLYAEDRRNRSLLPDVLWGERVLVVDDNPDSREHLQALLSALSLSPSLCATPAQARALLLSEQGGPQPFRYLLVDWGLPGKDGVVAVIEMRAMLKAELPEGLHPRIILLSAFGQDEIKNQAERAGVDYCLDKPISRDRLVTALSGGWHDQEQHKDRRKVQQLAAESEIGRLVGGAYLLLVEDNPINQQVAAELLERVGLVVDIAENGQQALDRLARFEYDLVLMDLHMPVMDGSEAMQRIRAQEAWRSLPVLALSTGTGEEEQLDLQDLGFQGFLHKPIRPERLYGALKRWITRPTLDASWRIVARGDEVPLLRGVDPEIGINRLAGNQELYVVLLSRFFQLYAEVLPSMQQQLQRGQWAVLGRQIHGLRNRAAALGAVELAKAVVALELAMADGHEAMIEAAFQSFSHRLEQVLQGIASHQVEQKGVALSSNLLHDDLPELVVDLHQVGPLLDQLAGRLKYHSIDAAALLQALGELLKETPLATAYWTVCKQVDRYNFYEALQSFLLIAKALKYPIIDQNVRCPASVKERILIVDDQPDNVDVLKDILEDYERMAALSGPEALMLAQCDPAPDMVLLDIMMPEMNGYEVCRRLKAMEATQEIPVIFVSAKKEVVDEAEGFLIGGVDYITKPYHGEVVRRRIHSQLELKRHRERLEKQVRMRTAELELATREAELRKDEAEAGNRAKSEFLAIMSHEIRTPLNAILGTHELLSESALSSEQQRLMEISRNAGELLLNLVNETLDLAKIEAGKLDLEYTIFDLPRLVEEITQIKRVAAEHKGVRLESEMALEVPRFVMGDPDRLRQILVNLLSNAIKFTNSGTVSLQMSRGVADRTFFKVSDTGVGIAAHSMEKIFHPFTQADTSTTRKFGGTGLGLTICKHLCEAMGGDIQVESQVGVGSTFSVNLPLPRAESSMDEPSAPEEVIVEQVQAPLRILAVDDAEDNRKLVQAFLAKSGHHLDLCEDGAQALDRFKREHYDLVLMDLLMPVLDGYGATRKIRQWEQQQHRLPTPIIALTALSVRRDLDKALACGCDFYLTKPFRKHQLLDAIYRIHGMLAGSIHQG